MNILDAVIIVVLLIGALAGYRRGLIKQAVLLVGLIACLRLTHTSSAVRVAWVKPLAPAYLPRL